ncbi:uncharacterized protein LOC110860248 [Folsomia candida]|uniref:uncharacterized protein LOC110860248 n=1 Tax=Folsomia candida TaxID=158441 RepID=UPI000B8FD8FB|nr:uncharacterized protein LOC110860248 [Folsomia candida]
MNRRCSVVQILTIIIGLVNFILGVPILVHNFLENHDYGENESREEINGGWSWTVFDTVRLTVVLSLLLLLTSSSIGCVWSGFETKYQELLARGALILLKISTLICAVYCLAMFVLGYHWINLIPLLVWGCVCQLIFCVVIWTYVKELTVRRGDSELTIPL